jgi:CheY-like chemotaxis protein
MAKSVLIVEDNEHQRNIYASILRFSGYEIVEAENGADAIEKAASAQPHLILLDFVLPDMNGIDVARSIKRNQRSAHIPIIGCSAFTIGEEREDSLAAGYGRLPAETNFVRGTKSKDREIYLALENRRSSTKETAKTSCAFKECNWMKRYGQIPCRSCPPCNGYLSIVLREPEHNTRL